MTSLYLINDLAVDTMPWVYVEEANNKIYVIAFDKLLPEIEQTVYENYNIGASQDFFSDYDAQQFLQIDTLKQQVFANAYGADFEFKFLKGSQLGCGAGNSLFFLSETLVYTFDPAASVSIDDTRELQLLRIYTSNPGRLSLIEPFEIDKDIHVLEETTTFNKSVVLHILADLKATSLANCAVILHGHPIHGHVLNVNATPTSNAYETAINYLPSIELASETNTIFTDIQSFVTISANLVYANLSPYFDANTGVHFRTTKGLLFDAEEFCQNNTCEFRISAGLMANNQTMRIYAGWSNYFNVANIHFQTLAPETPDGELTTAGTFSFTAPVKFNTLVVRLWGGGGGGGGYDDDLVTFRNGANGGNSTFINSTSLVAQGGKGGNGALGVANGVNGDGGPASGGDINTKGYKGILVGYGGNAPGSGGGAGGPIDREGSSPGGGGGGANVNFGSEPDIFHLHTGAGGSGGYVLKKYTGGREGNPIFNNPVTVVVGAKGTGNTSGDIVPGANGGVGAVLITWS